MGCLVVTIHDKNKKQGALVHLDALTKTADSIKKLIAKFDSKDASNLEAFMIGETKAFISATMQKDILTGLNSRVQTIAQKVFEKTLEISDEDRNLLCGTWQRAESAKSKEEKNDYLQKQMESWPTCIMRKFL